MRLAIVDDARIERAVFRNLCVSLGHDVVVDASNLADGIVAVRDARPDAIVVDGRIGEPAARAVAALRAASPESAVYVIASLEERATVVLARDAGAAGAIRRPIARSDLRATFGRVPPEDASNA